MFNSLRVLLIAAGVLMLSFKALYEPPQYINVKVDNLDNKTFINCDIACDELSGYLLLIDGSAIFSRKDKLLVLTKNNDVYQFDAIKTTVKKVNNTHKALYSESTPIRSTINLYKHDIEVYAHVMYPNSFIKRSLFKLYRHQQNQGIPATLILLGFCSLVLIATRKLFHKAASNYSRSKNISSEVDNIFSSDLPRDVKNVQFAELLKTKNISNLPITFISISFLLSALLITAYISIFSDFLNYLMANHSIVFIVSCAFLFGLRATLTCIKPNTRGVAFLIAFSLSLTILYMSQPVLTIPLTCFLILLITVFQLNLKSVTPKTPVNILHAT